MKRCKYLLPCGRCDKYDILCDATVKKLEIYDSLEAYDHLESKKECKHEWRYEGQFGNGHHYKCIKCDTFKAVPLENLG